MLSRRINQCKWGLSAGILSLALLLSACGSAASGGTGELQGDPVSPDGAYSLELKGDTLRLLRTEDETTVWETAAHAWQSVCWESNGNLLALAYGEENSRALTVRSTRSDASWDFSSQEGTLPTENWGAWEENLLFLTLSSGKCCCAVSLEEDGSLAGEVLSVTEETLPESYDFDRDGVEESAIIRQVGGNAGWWQLLLREGEQELWRSEDFSLAHVGWGSLFACKIQGQDCLLHYEPYGNMGWLNFSYWLSYLAEDGSELTIEQRTVYCDCNGNARPEERLNPAEMADFLETVHGYLEGGVLLLSTEGGEWHTPGSPGVEFWDDYAVLWNEDDSPYDESLSLEENLRNSWAMQEN